MNRRSLIIGLTSALAAPAIVCAESLMKIVVPKPAPFIIPYGWPSRDVVELLRMFERARERMSHIQELRA